MYLQYQDSQHLLFLTFTKTKCLKQTLTRLGWYEDQQ